MTNKEYFAELHKLENELWLLSDSFDIPTGHNEKLRSIWLQLYTLKITSGATADEMKEVICHE